MGYVNWSYEELNRFCQDVFESFGFTKEESGIITECIAHRRFIWIWKPWYAKNGEIS